MIEGALRRDRVVVVFALLGVIILAWGYLLLGAGMSLDEMGGMPMAQEQPIWTPAYAAVVLAMWAVMMAAMMLPTAMPMVTVFGTLNKNRGEAGRTVAFVAGYLALWTAFAAAATAAQWTLHARGLLSPMIVSMSPVLSAALLMIAGAFQFTPLKRPCLRACRSPLGFLLTDWRSGLGGAALQLMGLPAG